MATFYLNSGSISDLVVSNNLAATGSLFGTASYGKTASSANAGNLVVAAGGSTNTISQLVFSNANGVSFGLNGSTLTATAAGGGGGVTLNYYNPQDAYVQTVAQLGQGTLFMQPAQMPNVQYDRIMFPVSYTNASNSSNSFTVSFWAGFYTRNISTLSLLTSYSTSYNITNSGNVTNAGSFSLYSGLRLLSIGLGGNTDSLQEDQYYFGIISRTTTGGGAGMTMSNVVATQQNAAFLGLFGSATNASMQYTRGLGVYSATTTALPSAIPFSDLRGAGQTTYLRQPMFYVVNGTF